MNIVIDNQIQEISDLIKKIKFRRDINFILINSDDFKNKNLMIDLSGALEDENGKKDISKIDKLLNLSAKI